MKKINNVKKGTRSGAVLKSLIAASVISLAFYILLPLAVEGRSIIKTGIESISDFVYGLCLLLHSAWIIFIFLRRKTENSVSLKLASAALTVTLLMFLFSYLYAYNAGLEYVQRFALTSDVLSFAPDTRAERIYAFFLYLPLFITDLSALFILEKRKGRKIPGQLAAMLLALLSSILYALSFPSFFHSDGFPPLAFAALIPLIAAVKYSSVPWAIFWSAASGVFQTVFLNYWLSTFSLVSLQAVIIIYLFHYLVFMIPFVLIFKYLDKNNIKYSWLVFPFFWVALEYFRAKGFTAYPWCLLGSSQYRFLSFIQIASVTGIWGVSFITAFINSAAAHTIFTYIDKKKIPLFPAAAAAVIFSVSVIWGTAEISKLEREAPEKKISIAIIQQNTDPRKDEYSDTLDVLIKLTDRAVAEAKGKTDIVAWSETAFVPNLRRWGGMNPEEHPYARLAHRFLDYQKSLGLYLLTGNDDYEDVTVNGETERFHYNAAVLFSGSGRRLETYRKIQLVPFTEYFPYKEELPRLYALLEKMDVNLWEPGKEYTVFRHPDFTFSTPVCFEDIFPDLARRFAAAGADVILNISNDYWSLTETEGKQHFISSLFRSVENRKPLVRATASGLTGTITRTGKITAVLPFYEEAYLNAEIEIHNSDKDSIYTRYGDYFPVFCTFMFAFFPAAALLRRITVRKS